MFETLAETDPDRPDAAIMYLNTRVLQDDPVGTIQHELNHGWDRWTFTEQEMQRIWSGVDAEQRQDAHAQYYFKDGVFWGDRTESQQKEAERAMHKMLKAPNGERQLRMEWFNYQMARVLSGQSTEFDTTTKQMVQAYADVYMREPLKK